MKTRLGGVIAPPTMTALREGWRLAHQLLCSLPRVEMSGPNEHAKSRWLPMPTRLKVLLVADLQLGMPWERHRCC